MEKLLNTETNIEYLVRWNNAINTKQQYKRYLEMRQLAVLFRSYFFQLFKQNCKFLNIYKKVAAHTFKIG